MGLQGTISAASPRDQLLAALLLASSRFQAARKEWDNGERLFEAAIEFVRRNGMRRALDPMDPRIESIKLRVTLALGLPAGAKWKGRRVARPISRARLLILWLATELGCSGEEAGAAFDLGVASVYNARAATEKRRSNPRFRRLSDQLLQEFRLQFG